MLYVHANHISFYSDTLYHSVQAHVVSIFRPLVFSEEYFF